MQIRQLWIGLCVAVQLLLLGTGCCAQFWGGGGGALAFEPAELPPPHLGEPYEAVITVTQNKTPVGDFYATGDLPGGLEFAWLEGDSFARISGTPAETGTFEIVVSVWCLGTNVSGQTGEQKYTLTVN